MTEQPLLPPPEDPAAPGGVPPGTHHRDLVPWLYGLGFLILASAIFYIWLYPGTPGETAATAPIIQAVEQRLADIDGRLTRLEQRPVPDIAQFTGRLNAMDGRIADQTRLASQMDTMSGRIESLSGRSQAVLDSTKQQIDALTARVAAADAKASALDAATKRLNRIARLQEASFALASGRPVGDVPNAPEALARYSRAAPPTEEQLRLRFQRDQQSVLTAKQPDPVDAPFIGRVWQKAEGLITIRQGDDVVVGNQTAVILNQAQAALDAGDLPAAIGAVEELKGQPAQIMATWLGDAKNLLSARSALAQMADQA